MLQLVSPPPRLTFCLIAHHHFHLMSQIFDDKAKKKQRLKGLKIISSISGLVFFLNQPESFLNKV